MIARIKRYRTGMAVLTVTALSIMILGCSTASAENTPAASVTEVASAGIPASVIYWQQQSPQYQIVKYATGDLSRDGRDDAVIVYSLGNDTCEMVAVISQADGYKLTQPVRAPLSDQKISFIHMTKSSTEVVISGRHGDVVGTGIFRLEAGQLESVFSDDYDGCC